MNKKCDIVMDIEAISLNSQNYHIYIDQIDNIEQKTFVGAWSKDAYIKDICENDLAFYVVLAKENTVVAYANYWLIDEVGNINNVAVADDFRQQGYGLMLMKSLIEDCRLRGGKSMTLEVRESNFVAIALYEKLGFINSGIRPDYYEDNHENAIIMWLNFDI